MPHGLFHGDEGAGFVKVVDCFTRRAIAWAGLLSQARVSPSQPKRVKPQPSSRCFRACSFLFHCEPASERLRWWALEFFVQAPTQGVVGVVDAQLEVFKAYQSVKQVPVQTAKLAVLHALDLVVAFVVLVILPSTTA